MPVTMKIMNTFWHSINTDLDSWNGKLGTWQGDWPVLKLEAIKQLISNWMSSIGDTLKAQATPESWYMTVTKDCALAVSYVLIKNLTFCMQGWELRTEDPSNAKLMGRCNCYSEAVSLERVEQDQISRSAGANQYKLQAKIHNEAQKWQCLPH